MVSPKNATAILAFLGWFASVVDSHTWLFTRGRASMEVPHTTLRALTHALVIVLSVLTQTYVTGEH